MLKGGVSGRAGLQTRSAGSREREAAEQAAMVWGWGKVVSVRLSVHSLFKNMPLGAPWCLAIRPELSPEDA